MGTLTKPILMTTGGCGDATRMAPDVEKAFIALYQDKAGVSEQDAQTWMAELKSSQRYLVDVWPRNS
jgi:cytochrome P450/NADPH-cytochrome P450 reductase